MERTDHPGQPRPDARPDEQRPGPAPGGGTDGHGRRVQQQRRWILVLVSAGFLAAVSDSTIVYTALPSIGRGLGMAADDLTWVVVVFLLTSGGLLLLGGRSADLLGRRAVFLAGTALFTTMSLLAGLAWSPAALIAARTLQGVGAAAMVPAGLSILTVTFPEGEQRNSALGVWGALAGIGATGGLLLGGPLTHLGGWRWIFLVNVPVGALILLFGPAVLPAGRPTRTPSRRFDVLGAMTSSLALFVLIAAIVTVPQRGAGTWTFVSLAVAGGLAATFVVTERRAADPLVPLRLFRSRSLVGGNLVILAAGMCVDGLLFTFTLFVQEALGHSAIGFALAMSAMTATSFVGVVVGQRWVTRRGAGPVAAGGLALICVGALVLTRVDADSGLVGVPLLGLVLFGPGMGAAFVAGQIAALTGIAAEDAGFASGVEETTFAVGSALGAAAAASLIAARAELIPGARGSFAVTAAIAGLGFVGAALLLGRGRRPRPHAAATSTV